MINYKLTLCYDGTRYHGWQNQKNQSNTIQNKIETLLGRIFDECIEVNASGRTDAGVHARALVCSFKAENKSHLSTEDILGKMRSFLPKDIGAVALETAPERFHARYCAKGKTYVYRIWISDRPCVFERDYVYFFNQKVDVALMEEAARKIMGTHDFTPFTTNKRMKKSAVRCVDRISLSANSDEITVTVHGDGFLYNMVRIIVGTLLEVGTGKKSVDDIDRIFASSKREDAGFTVPACGLILWEVDY